MIWTIKARSPKYKAQKSNFSRNLEIKKQCFTCLIKLSGPSIHNHHHDAVFTDATVITEEKRHKRESQNLMRPAFTTLIMRERDFLIMHRTEKQMKRFISIII